MSKDQQSYPDGKTFLHAPDLLVPRLIVTCRVGKYAEQKHDYRASVTGAIFPPLKSAIEMVTGRGRNSSKFRVGFGRQGRCH